MRIRLLRLAPVALACALACHAVAAQQNCQPPLPPPAPGQNLFTPQQEMDLGDAIAEQVQHNYRVIDDDALTAELRRIGARVVKGLPDTGLRFQFFLLDAPDPDAFTLPGGRIYISRKLIAFVQSEDELASILAHELGHVASRQTALDMSSLFREVLGVTSAGDRRDIFDKYHQLVENAARKPKAFEHGARIEEREQLVADQLGLYALAGAGYDPAALPGFWERFTETKGKSGGFLAALFGASKPEEKRLREMRRALTTRPAACAAPRATTPAASFKQWQAAVVAYANAARKEALHGVISKTALEPPLRGDVAYLRFSPDGRYFIAGARNFSDNNFWGTLEERASALIYDLTTKARVPVPNTLKVLLTGRYAFIGADKLVARNPQDYRRSALVGFPGGAVIEQFALWGLPYSVTRGDYFIVRPVREYAAGVAELSSKNVILANRLTAIDLNDQFFVAEQLNGELCLYRVAHTEQSGRVVLPRNPLGRLYANAVSPDMRWLALSERTRGAVWDLAKGTRVLHMRNFRGAYFAPDGAFYADFPRTEETERTLAKLDPATGHAISAAKLEARGASEHGPYISTMRPAREGGTTEQNATLELRDTATQTQLWTRAFPDETPDVWVDPADNTVVLVWPAASDAAKAAAAPDPNLKQQLAGRKEKDRDYFLQVLDAKTGQVRGGLVVETGKGSFRVDSVFAAGDWVVVADTENRVLVYSLARGAQQGRVFGGRATLSPAAGLLAVENERGRLTVYELATMSERDEFDFDSPVMLGRFSADGKRLLVVTANQTAYVLSMEKP